MTTLLPFSEAKSHLSDLADRVEHEHERILVTRNGRPSFILVSPDDLDSLEQTLELLSTPEALLSIRISRQQAEDGELVDLPADL
jgi:antitoxin YefM